MSDVRVLDTNEGKAHEELKSNAARAQVYATLHLAEQTKRVAAALEYAEQRRQSRYQASAGF